jgi:hypothetical protein
MLLSCCPKNSQDVVILAALKAVQDAEKNHPAHKYQVQRLIPITFHALQQALTTAPVLQLPDFDQSCVVECDSFGARGVCSSASRLISVARLLRDMLTWLHMNAELIGLVQAVRH